MQIHKTGTNRFDLRASELNARLKSSQDVIIPESLAVGNNLRGHRTPACDGLFLRLLAVLGLSQD